MPPRNLERVPSPTTILRNLKRVAMMTLTRNKRRAKGKEEMMMNPTLMRRRAARVAKARRAERKVARSLRMMKNSRPTMTPPLMPSPLREESLMMTPTTSPLRVKRKEESLMMRTPMTRK
jgi:hypothetical protein